MRRKPGRIVLYILVFTAGLLLAGSDAPVQGEAARVPAEIRIGVLSGSAAVEIRLPQGGTLRNSSGTVIEDGRSGFTWSLKYHDGQINGPKNSRSSVFTARPSGGMAIVNGRQYRGAIQLRVDNRSLTVINLIGLEDYLKGVLPREMPTSWPMEALKAQAVAARTYTLANMGKHGKQHYDLCNQVHCQVYGAVAAENTRANQALEATSGIVALYNGKPISALYHSSSGGHTENAGHVWQWDVPYLKGVPDTDWSPNAYWVRIFTAAEIEAALRAQKRDVGTVIGMAPAVVTASGRVAIGRITGDQGALEFTGEQLRQLLNLRSSLFSIEWQPFPPVGPLLAPTAIQSPDMPGLPAALNLSLGLLAPGYQAPRWILRGSGWGHGVGMSQWGAWAMAGQGHTFDEILRYYYQGITMEEWGGR